MFWVYVLRSIKTGKYYIGQTNNIERRVSDHNRCKDHSSKLGAPWVLIFKKELRSRSEAIQLEKRLKSMKKRTGIEKFIALSYYDSSGVEQSGSSLGSILREA